MIRAGLLPGCRTLVSIVPGQAASTARCARVRHGANGPGGSRTHTRVAPQRILSPLVGFASGDATKPCDKEATSDSRFVSTHERSLAVADAEIADVVEAWATLPKPVRVSIVDL